MYDQWTTTCPNCKVEDSLVVAEATLCATGKTVRPNSTLHSDGFDVDPNCQFLGLKDFSTENEVVVCTACLTRFSLDDLSLDNQ